MLSITGKLRKRLDAMFEGGRIKHSDMLVKRYELLNSEYYNPNDGLRERLNLLSYHILTQIKSISLDEANKIMLFYLFPEVDNDSAHPLADEVLLALWGAFLMNIKFGEVRRFISRIDRVSI